MLFIVMISIIYILSPTSAQNVTNYEVPEVTVQALRPNGFRIYIPGDPRIKLFHFEANFYDSNKQFYKSIREFVIRETNGNWVYEDRETPLKVGDTVVYYIFVTFQQGITDIFRWKLTLSGYTGRGQHKITKENIIEDPDTAIHTETCKKTVTKVLNGIACSGQPILEDNFNTLREDLWQIEQYIPKDHPYHPFVSYQNMPSSPTVLVKDGLLIIEPKLQQNMPGFNNRSLYGELNLLDGCTGQTCVDTNLLPAVVSGKLSAKIAFTYGTVEIRAKMPIGNWLYPELQLESLTNKYGKLNYGSGVINIASVFGNKEMNDTSYSNKFLGGSAVINTRCLPLSHEKRKKIANGTWSDNFHVYSVKWTPDFIEFYVDGEMWNRLRPGRKGLRSWLPLNCRKGWFELLGKGGNMAPFDHYFYLTLSVAAGGMMFPDSTRGAKPWHNNERKASLHFSMDLPNWYQTWTQPLIIDYVKIIAL